MTATAIDDDASAHRRDTAFLGHPAGLGWLAFSELWERFSYYGMLALLPLYLVHRLLLPGHVEHIVGFGPFAAFVGLFYGGNTASPMVLKAHITGLYAAFVYLTPLGGGYLADRYLGRTRAVTIGALLMAFGHFLMAFEASFVGAVLCLVLGVGFFKGNISSQVGSLYKTDDPRRANAFQIFLLSVQIAVIISPLVCSTLGELYSWDLGFGAAGIGMLIGLTIYLIGRPTLPKEAPRVDGVAQTPPLTKTDYTKIWVLIALLPVMAIGIVGNQQISNAYPNWAETHFNLFFFGHLMPTGWLQTVDAIFSTATMLMVIAFWRWWETRWTEPDELMKITLGIAISALAPLALAAASAIVASTHQKVGVGWAFLFETLNDIGFANVLPVGLALYTRAAPKRVLGLVVGIYYLHLFAGNYFTGWVAGWLDIMPAATFWLLHVAFMAASAVLLLLARGLWGSILAPAYTDAEAEAARA